MNDESTPVVLPPQVANLALDPALSMGQPILYIRVMTRDTSGNLQKWALCPTEAKEEGEPYAMTFVKAAEGEPSPPAFMVDDINTQFLMDELWRMGCRPSNQNSSAGQVEAMQTHIDDLRRLGFTLLDRQTPKSEDHV